MLWSSIPAKNQLWHTTSNFKIQRRTLELNIQLKHSTSHLVISISFSSRYWNRYLWNELSIIKHDVEYRRSFFFMFEVWTFPSYVKTRQRILKFTSIFTNQHGNEMVKIFSLDAVVKCWHCDKMLTPFCERRAIPAKKYQMSQGCVTS